jgi:hypothetical protein
MSVYEIRKAVIEAALQAAIIFIFCSRVEIRRFFSIATSDVPTYHKPKRAIHILLF